MTNVFEELLDELKSFTREEINRLIDRLPKEEHRPGIDLSNWIPSDKAAELFNVEVNTLLRYKEKIGYSKIFNKVYFRKMDLLNYLESGIAPTDEPKTIMRTKPGRPKSAA